jgi:hypothetical protein
VRERRAQNRSRPLVEERRLASTMSRWGLHPQADLLELTLATMTYRLARFGLDGDAGPLLMRRKRGN